MPFHIAVLEDDAEFRNAILVPELVSFGFAVEGFGTSAELQARMQATSFDALVLDIGLTGEHGLDVARRLRAGSPIGIVILTGRGLRDEQLCGLRESVDAWLSKPVDMDLLAATLTSVARRRRSEIRSDVAAPPAAQWHLDRTGWELVAPDGRRLALNLPERVMLMRLFSAPGETVTRDELIESIAASADEFDAHRLEMMVHRLRRRALEQLGAPPPIRAIRGIGYVALVAVGPTPGRT